MYATLDVNDDGKGLFDKLKSVKKWCSEWQLSISVKKCAVMHIHSGNTRPAIGPKTGPYSRSSIGPSFDIGGYALPTVDHVKDLGVLVDDCLKFHLHVNHIVSSAFTRANLILKCFNSRNVQVLLRKKCEHSRSMCCQSLNMLLAFGLLTSLLISMKLKVFSANLLSAFLAGAT